jgi:hypothetical protein
VNVNLGAPEIDGTLVIAVRGGAVAYCLMANHVHLIVVPGSEEAVTRAICEAHRRYAREVNLGKEWRGYL